MKLVQIDSLFAGLVRATKVCLETVNRYEENRSTDETTKQTIEQMVHQARLAFIFQKKMTGIFE